MEWMVNPDHSYVATEDEAILTGDTLTFKPDIPSWSYETQPGTEEKCAMCGKGGGYATEDMDRHAILDMCPWPICQKGGCRSSAILNFSECMRIVPTSKKHCTEFNKVVTEKV